MFAIVGAAGKVGYSTSSVLRQAGAPVRAILRDETKASRLRAIGCEVALADLQDPAGLGRALADAEAVQIILPPPLQAHDSPADMRRSTESLAQALERARPKRVLAISDYGAHVREDVGMPAMYRIFEDRLRQLELPKVFLRSAEHMEGWGPIIPVVIATGILPSLHHPVEGTFPTVSAPDVGRIAADLLLRPGDGVAEHIVHAEGPRRYAATDVAVALGQLLERAVTAQALPRPQWEESLNRVVSASTANLLSRLYDAHNRGGLIDVEPDTGEVRYGDTDLIDALRPLVLAATNAG
jgi:NAD(P)H dehydrogenase (quinone)